MDDFVDREWDAEERELVAHYLTAGIVVMGCMGFSQCRICGRNNGNLELSDGVFIWPEGLVHYVTDHDVRLPEAFVKHVDRWIDAYARAHQSRDTSWWVSHASGQSD